MSTDRKFLLAFHLNAPMKEKHGEGSYVIKNGSSKYEFIDGILYLPMDIENGLSNILVYHYDCTVTPTLVDVEYNAEGKISSITPIEIEDKNKKVAKGNKTNSNKADDSGGKLEDDKDNASGL